MSYTAKTNWQGNDPVTEGDLNRWEQGIKDSHEGLSKKIEATEKGIAGGVATLDENGKLKSGQLDIPATPEGTTTTKGIVQLSSATDSPSETLAATPKAVKDAKDGLSNQISVLSDNTVPYGIASGADTKTITISSAFTILKIGLALSFKNTTANTTVVTLNVNGLGAKPIVKSGGTALSSGNLKAGGVYTVRYDGTSFILQGEGGSGNAVASDLLSGKTASADAGDIIGTMVDRGVFNLALGAAVPAGFYSGGTVPSGKKFASGNTTTLITEQTKIITGLGFRPRMIVVEMVYGGTTFIGFYSENTPYFASRFWFRNNEFPANSPYALTSGNTISSGADSFMIRTQDNGISNYSTTIRWFAYE